MHKKAAVFRRRGTLHSIAQFAGDGKGVGRLNGDAGRVAVQPLRESDAAAVVAWNEGRDADFLAQWAGRGYAYPLTQAQILGRLAAPQGARLYRIELRSVMIGTVEFSAVDLQAGAANVARFLMNPAEAGRGYGTAALLALCDIARQEGLKKVTLTVFSFNRPALRCYEKAGFAAAGQEERPNGWIAIRMEKPL